MNKSDDMYDERFKVAIFISRRILKLVEEEEKNNS
jgi:hypothetical protein